MIQRKKTVIIRAHSAAYLLSQESVQHLAQESYLLSFSFPFIGSGQLIKWQRVDSDTYKKRPIVYINVRTVEYSEYTLSPGPTCTTCTSSGAREVFMNIFSSKCILWTIGK